jgi:hypothetical protein
MLRGELDLSVDYVRGLGGNRIGFGGGGDLSIGWKKAKWRPHLGPFIRFDYTIYPGRNAKSYAIGLALTLTELADLD